MNDPYKTLGVSCDATDEEIKKAYRDLARKYHPDNYADNPLAELCEEKMKEINEAYDAIRKSRAESAAGGSSAGANGTTGSASYRGSSGPLYTQIRQLIRAGQYSRAEVMLDAISVSDRGAEWNFLKGCVLTQRGWFYDAQKYYETACYMDPNNQEYRAVLNNVRSSASAYGRGYRTEQTAGGCSGCDMCSGLLCADCCCECMGADCIRCC
ncbi:MAG: J domain-containing protein [Lachnospiraceae bacterium]|nr:J domain-containing protein [Lachnospiraceae bacterium]